MDQFKINEGELKINISLEYQMYVHSLIKASSMCYMENNTIERAKCLLECIRIINFKMNKDDVKMMDQVKELIKYHINNIKKGKVTMATSSSNHVPEFIKDAVRSRYILDDICDDLLEFIVQVMDKAGMLMPEHKAGSEALTG